MTDQPENNEPKPKKAKTGGKPFGWRKPQELNELKNGISVEKIFSLVPENTVPKESRQSFLKSVERLIDVLGIDNLNEFDLEEVCMLCREKVLVDGQFKFIADSNQVELNILKQIETMSKLIETKKVNLAARCIDKDKRKDNSGGTFLELFTHFKENREDYESLSDQRANYLENAKAKYTNLDEYMDSATNGLIEEKKEE